MSPLILLDREETGVPRDDSSPSYEQLFGELDFRDVDEARSVTSPSAYFVDLLALLESAFDRVSLLERRPDLRHIPLDAANTFTETPYLDIVNEVLERFVGGDPYETLRTRSHPFGLPFSLRHERIARYLHYLQVSPEELYRLFAPRPDQDVLARVFLGLSPEDVAVVTTVLHEGVPADEAALKACYGLADGESLAELRDLGRFRRATGLDAEQVNGLLAPVPEPPAAPGPPAPVTPSFITPSFLAQDGPGATVSADGKTLMWGDSPDVPFAWFERVNRFIRLARLTGLAPADLDVILATCGDGRLDLAALRAVAAVIRIQRERDLTVVDACALACPMRLADVELCSGDILDPRNDDYRLRLARSIDVAESDIVTIVRRYRERYAAQEPSPFDRGDFTADTVSLLWRAGHLATALGVSADELFGLLTVLENDPAPQRYGVPADNAFPVLGDAPGTRDCYRILESADASAGLWLVQTLFAVVDWARSGGFDARELTGILGGPPEPDGDADLRTVLNGVVEAFDEAALTPDLFVSDRFGERAAQVVHDVLTAYDGDGTPSGIVSAADERLLRLDPAMVPSAAYDAVTDLGVIVPEDFLGLGLGDRLTAKIHTNLVLLGHLRGNGELVTENTEGLTLASDFTEYAEMLFKLIGSMVNGSASFFPSDLETLDHLSAAARTELYDNLIFNGYLDEDGAILRPDFFLDADNAARFAVNADLSDVAQQVAGVLSDRVATFRDGPLPLDRQIFAGLGLTDAEQAALVENLRFNGYLTADDTYADKTALAALPLTGFAIALEFYPRRREILAAMRRQIAEFRAGLYVFAPEDFAAIADEAMAHRVMAALDGPYTRDGRVLDEALFADTGADTGADTDADTDIDADTDTDADADVETDAGTVTDAGGALDLGPGFTAAEQKLVRDRIVAILGDERPYRLDLAALTGLGLTDDEAGRVVDLLVAAGHLTEGRAVPEDRLGYFGDVGNALEFTLTGLADYERDIFFLLHTVAGELTAAVTEIGDVLTAQAARQSEALYGALSDAFGAPPATVEAVCAAVAGPEPLDLLVGPVLAATGQSSGRAGGPDGGAAHVPADPRVRLAYRRIRRFSLLAGKLGLSPTEVAVVFRDQDLVAKFPEPLPMPPGIDRFDALLTGFDDVVYLFATGGYWTYDAATYALTAPAPKPLTDLSPHFAGLTGVDAAFTLPDGTGWIIGRGADGLSHVFTREPGGERWAPKRDLVWGKLRNEFDDPARIDCAYVDADGRTYLFSGDQYVRYSGPDYTVADEGYPRDISEWWHREGGSGALPAPFSASIDACFEGVDGRTHLFAGGQWLAVGDGAAEPAQRPIAEVWGKVRNVFADGGRVDAAYGDGTGAVLLRGDQLIRYSGSVENDGAVVDDGHPQRIRSGIRDVPPGFETGVEAALVDGQGVLHLFKNGRTVAVTGPDSVSVPTGERWGVLRPALPSGTVDAAFAGLDGRTYLFSGDTYLRYSDAAYATVDLGYPRLISRDWGGLDRVDAAFVMDGRTYLFGVGGLLFDLPPAYEADLDSGTLTPEVRRLLTAHGLTATTLQGAAPEWTIGTREGGTLTVRKEGLRLKVFGDGTRFHVRYSTRDYTTPDEGYPKPLSDNWWNLPDGLALDPIDAVLTGGDGRTYLFSGGRYVVFDNRRRWWSEPRDLREQWHDLPFQRVDAAFTGQDGRTYLFSEDRFVRYSAGFTAIDDGYPQPVTAHWGVVVNEIARTGKVDATLVREVLETVDGVEVTRTYTYLFSGGQYVRYSAGDLSVVDDGYPRALASLAEEPGLAGLGQAGLGVTPAQVDGAFADRRNSYLFDADGCHVVSNALYRRYPGAEVGGLDGLRCVFVEDGSVLVEDATGWTRRSALEGRTVTATPYEPRTLREVPERFRSGLDSVLMGADGNTYLFKGASCFNVGLNREYPLADEWGRPRNTIYEDNAVDAAFVGTDGRTYLFRGDQFVVYPGHDDPDADDPEALAAIDGDPKPIAEHWGGLTAVSLAYVRNGTTYLFEPPDEAGNRRYVVYSGTTYDTPDEGYPAVADATFWGAPDGFPAPDAVLFEGDTMLLISGDRCLSYGEKTGRWSFPRPLDRIWPGIDQGLDPGDTPRTAFTALDGATYFFFRDHYRRYADGVFGPPAPIRDRWALSANPFVPADGTGTVDAAVVWRGETTYLFSGDHYVRYTGPDYRHIDPGYPKKIAGNLRREEAFANLAETFDDDLIDVTGATVHPIDGVIANDRNVYVFVNGACHIASRTIATTYPLDVFGRVRNTIAERGAVDAAFVAGGHTYLLSGDQYVRYTGYAYDEVDDGYPRTIAGSLPAELGMPEPPDGFRNGVDAAFRAPTGETYLFKGKQYAHAGGVEPIAGRWGRIRNDFAGGTVDAAFVAPTGELYAFRTGQYIRYRPGEFDLVEEGYPRTVKDDWGDLPADFEDGPDGAFVFAGGTYLLKGDRYVRYSAGDYRTVDPTFPQPFAYRWSDTADYRLSDVRTIVAFVNLARSRSEGLAELMLSGAEDPYRYLSDLFGWDLEELRWARRNSGLLTVRAAEEPDIEIEFLLRLAHVFGVAERFAAGPSEIYTTVWARLHGETPDPDAAATALYGLLERANSPQDWQTLSAQVHNELNVRKRDALVPYVIATHPELANSRALFERLLIDVDMGPAGTTSRVREAIAATQLYIQRYLLDLEPVSPAPGTDLADARRHIKAWWTWMRNYRVWEANRKVFLYPENYLRPELRPGKTPAFQALENDLLQGEITPDRVRAAYKRYLDEYTEVSRLSIAGGYVYAEDDAPVGARRLVLFGRTRTDPRRYYFRTAAFQDGEKLSATWDPWVKVDVQIDADEVDPVHAFGRIFVFWAVVEDVPPDNSVNTTTIVTRDTDDGQRVSAPPQQQRIRISYSFRNLDDEWVPAQLLAVTEPYDGPISDVDLYVQASRTLPGGPPGDHDSIVVTCSFTVPRPAWEIVLHPELPARKSCTSAYSLTPELYTLPAQGETPPARAADPAEIFAEPSGSIDRSTIVRFNAPADSTDGPWFSVDHKGGSFLCRPVSVPAPAADLVPLKGNDRRLPPAWARIDAAVALPDGTRYFFDNAGGSYITVPPGKSGARQPRHPIGERWGIIGTALVRTGVVDATLLRGDHVYLFSGPEYYRYRLDAIDRPEDGYPKRLAANEENLPRWDKIDLAFRTADGKEFFYSRALDRWVDSSALTLPWRAAERWPLPADGQIDAVRYAGSQILLIAGDRYFPLGPDGSAAGGLRPIPADDDHHDGRHAGRGDHDGQDGHDDALLLSLTDHIERALARPLTGPEFPYGNDVVSFDNEQHTYRMPGDDDASRPTRDLGRVATKITSTNSVDAAYVADGRLYLTSGDEYVRYTLGDGSSVPDYIDDGYPKQMYRSVDAVFTRGNRRYVFSDASYVRLPDGQELDEATFRAFDPIKGNWLGLPDDFPGAFTGVLDDESELFLFFQLGSAGYFAAYPKAVAVPVPYEIAALPHDIVRLTSSTAYQLNRRLLTGGVDALLAPETQEIDELPTFSADRSDATTIQVWPETVVSMPTGSHLDFQSSNGIYYWEIFCHAPLLIAQALNDAQRFEDARTWYEYVFDPSDPSGYWRFLPFLAVDVTALVRGVRADLDELGTDPAAEQVRKALDPILRRLEPLAPAFQQTREPTAQEIDLLTDLAGDGLDAVRTALAALPPGEVATELRERVEMIARLRRQYDLLGDRASLIRAYLDDPFDPHAIARLRPVAYRRAVVMAYIDNLLDWGDKLFTEYTSESIDEARMLYILAYDLLGDRPADLGPQRLSPTRTYAELRPAAPPAGEITGAAGTPAALPSGEQTEQAEQNGQPVPAGQVARDEQVALLTAGGELLAEAGVVHESIADPYFFVPANDVFAAYWTRVEDRLRKIRQSLDIMGVSRPVPLFEPPADVMALVRAAASGAPLDQVVAGASVPVPNYRFSFLYNRAIDLADRVRQFGGDLLSTLERRDAEELSLLQNRQEAAITELTRDIKEAQVKAAAEGVAELKAALDGANGRVQYFEGLLAAGLSAVQIAQIEMMSLAAAGHFAAGGLKIGAAIAAAEPQALAGPFISGVMYGGDEIGNALNTAADVVSTVAEGFSVTGEILAVLAEQGRVEQDWEQQLAMARTDVAQLGHQVAAAEAQLAIAKQELAILDQEAKNLDEIHAFLTGKFSSSELYGWMAGRLATMYFQTYTLAHEVARSAEQAYRFERGITDGAGAIIQPGYWEGRRSGLLAGEALSLDLQRLGRAYFNGGPRGLEITKKVSLLGLDPLALLALKSGGRCEFALTEALFDRDFPGHFRRQIKTVTVTFEGADGPIGINATLTQLDNRVVLSADPKAVKFLLDPKGSPPDTLRVDWRPGQQIALSDLEEYKDNNGLFELRFDDDRYLPFEGTGAVSRWRLDAGPHRVPDDLRDVTITVKYTAEQGGDAFATAVRGMLRPYTAAGFFDAATDFPDAWAEFVDDGTNTLTLPITPDLLPGLTGRQITAIYAKYQPPGTASGRFLLNGDDRLPLNDGKTLQTPGLTITNGLTFTFTGDPTALTTLGLVLTYRAGVP